MPSFKTLTYTSLSLKKQSWLSIKVMQNTEYTKSSTHKYQIPFSLGLQENTVHTGTKRAVHC